MLFKSTSPAQVIRQVFSGNTMKAPQPQFKSTVIRVDILNMESAIDTLALTEVDRFMTKPFGITEGLVGGVGITDQKRIDIQYRLERGGQQELGKGSVTGHEIQRLSGTITRAMSSLSMEFSFYLHVKR